MKSEFIVKDIGGLKCYAVKKKGYRQKQCMLVVRHGSKDNIFSIDGHEEVLPEGAEHFLEHKMFAQKEENVFEKFSKLGASVNAFTNFSATAFHFTCVDNFGKCMDLLSDMLNNPYFTDENVENEKNIICREIKMYDDDFMWKVYFNMVSLLYRDNTIKNNIAGTLESVGRTTKEDLYKCYDNFYNKENAALICCGDIDENMFFEKAGLFFKNNKKSGAKSNNGKKTKITQNYIKADMDTKRRIFAAGFNDNDFSDDPIYSTVCTRLALELICGRASDLYEELSEKYLIDDTFSCEYNCTDKLGFYYLNGFADEPTRVLEKFYDYAERLVKKGIDEKEFEVAKNALLGRMIDESDDIYSVMSLQADLYTKNSNISEFYSEIKNIEYDSVAKRAKSIANNKNAVLSVVEPIK